MNGHFAIGRLLLATALPIEAKIHKACIEGNTEEVVRLMNSKIAINIDDINQKKTILVAVRNQNVTTVRELLKMNIDVDQTWARQNFQEGDRIWCSRGGQNLKNFKRGD